ncbi:bifunctional phosphoribosyl-AMP cyclohydrolase/phosphoribosyl-ATP diphosphatase HisIE [Luteibaculum oceani]|uniref:Histidine biosynthesis bifunctional protein HisIE n=1 Tax=Luteibaculum oceani TaxID=1294296 RepID=A0A5C6VCZ0_9FLAO|nr:bifunctional phosphoribosyl-AMP cyclohydrolase/phosphoribosyl-ATP diphosphatase HisIE [Luteibaculum oceani]TXC81475.1 bifunctional phosphoribosyl-AMP cyclohydrolase/phosphoribosyl-ATP diphosphatase HisIE [Luteibaculum oceani]
MNEISKDLEDQVEFSKYSDGLVPAIIQDSATGQVLMLGFMNQEALSQTLESGKATFFSRSKNRLWTKGESSGNFLIVENIYLDCDKDTLLVKARPSGPTCHTGEKTCFKKDQIHSVGFLEELNATLLEKKNSPEKASYTSSLHAKGINKIAQKVGEEAVELVIEAMDNKDDLFLNEAADLMYHYLVLIHAKGYQLTDVVKILQARSK